MNPSVSGAGEQITLLLKSIQEGNRDSGDRLMSFLYREMHGIAQNLMHRERPNHTLGPTGLLHEAYLKIFTEETPEIDNRRELFGRMIQAMHEVLIDYARRRNAKKRGSGKVGNLEEDVSGEAAIDEWIDELQRDYDFEKATQALKRLAVHNPDHYRTFVLRHYWNWKREQIAEALGCSLPTVDRYWLAARTYLQREINRDPNA